MLQTMPCPSAEEYLRLARGLTPAPEAERILGHLEGCQGCGRMVDHLPEGDTLVDLFREAATVLGESPPPSVIRLIDRLSRLTHERAGMPGDPTPARIPDQFSPDKPTVESYDWMASPQAVGEIGRLGPYQIHEVLGVGGMGIVFRARDPHLDRTVALKAMLPALASREGARQRFLREARAIAAIKHEHIVSIYQVGEDRGVPFLAMEFLEGETLDARVKREGRLPLEEVLRIGREIARGLSAAHQRGLIHRDIKPANLWLEAVAGRVKILDFGLVRAAGAERDLTQESAIVGTPEYMSPEQARGLEVDHRCDLFSLGCVLYRIATGDLPFQGTDTISTLFAISSHSPTPPAQRDTSLPAELSDLIMTLLAKAPSGRPSSSQEVAESLDRISLTSKTRTVAARPALRRRWPVSTGLAAGLLLAVAAILGAAIAFRFTTKEGVIVLEDLPANAEVLVDGTVVKVKHGPDGQWIVVGVAPGERKLEIKAEGFKIKTQDVTLSVGERRPIRIHLEPLNGGRQGVVAQLVDGWNGWPREAPRPAIAPFDSSEAKTHQEAWAKYLGVPVVFTNSAGMTFRLIPPGEFTMGSTAAEMDAAKPLLYTGVDPARPERVVAEGPQCRVAVTRPFYLGAHEVTQRQYERLRGENPSALSSTGNQRDRIAGRDTSDCPVENVSWHDATSFANLLSKAEGLPTAYRITAIATMSSLTSEGYRLPTEAEWEYACRAGTTTLFWSGDDEETFVNVSWYGANNHGNSTKPVGTRAANPFGLYDVHGNVWEWMDDGWDPVIYQRWTGPTAKDPHSETSVGGRKVMRGGDFFMSAAECRSACRDGYPADDRYDDLGFRLALSIDAVRKSEGRHPPSPPRR